MTETHLLQRIRLDLGREPGLRLFRNNCGKLRDPAGRWVEFGLHPGSGDLIGYHSLVVTPDLLGRRLAIFSSVEVKTETGRPTEQQVHWAEAVRAAGGFAGIARSPEQARLIVGLA